jgi:hypothetical protein
MIKFYKKNIAESIVFTILGRSFRDEKGVYFMYNIKK